MRGKLTGAAVFLFLVSSAFSAGAGEAVKKVCFGNICLQAELADTQLKRQKGLMFRRPLPDNEGMLFIFEREELHAFWMKNMRFPLDIIWMDKDKRIVDIRTNLAPCRFGPCPNIVPAYAVKYALEARAGFAQKNNVKIGDRASF